ncbi:hypothetical protein ACA910_013697 [Epithemia clementina (nom. ined.)]
MSSSSSSSLSSLSSPQGRTPGSSSSNQFSQSRYMNKGANNDKKTEESSCCVQKEQVVVLPSGYVLHENDVVLGVCADQPQSMTIQCVRPGNLRFRAMLQAAVPRYLASKKNKAFISCDIVNQIYRRGGRFIVQKSTTKAATALQDRRKQRALEVEEDDVSGEEYEWAQLDHMAACDCVGCVFQQEVDEFLQMQNMNPPDEREEITYPTRRLSLGRSDQEEPQKKETRVNNNNDAAAAADDDDDGKLKRPTATKISNKIGYKEHQNHFSTSTKRRFSDVHQGDEEGDEGSREKSQRQRYSCSSESHVHRSSGRMERSPRATNKDSSSILLQASQDLRQMVLPRGRLDSDAESRRMDIDSQGNGQRHEQAHNEKKQDSKPEGRRSGQELRANKSQPKENSTKIPSSKNCDGSFRRIVKLPRVLRHATPVGGNLKDKNGDQHSLDSSSGRTTAGRHNFDHRGTSPGLNVKTGLDRASPADAKRSVARMTTTNNDKSRGVEDISNHCIGQKSPPCSQLNNNNTLEVNQRAGKSNGSTVDSSSRNNHSHHPLSSVLENRNSDRLGGTAALHKDDRRTADSSFFNLHEHDRMIINNNQGRDHGTSAHASSRTAPTTTTALHVGLSPPVGPGHGGDGHHHLGVNHDDHSSTTTDHPHVIKKKQNKKAARIAFQTNEMRASIETSTAAAATGDSTGLSENSSTTRPDCKKRKRTPKHTLHHPTDRLSGTTNAADKSGQVRNGERTANSESVLEGHTSKRSFTATVLQQHHQSDDENKNQRNNVTTPAAVMGGSSLAYDLAHAVSFPAEDKALVQQQGRLLLGRSPQPAPAAVAAAGQALLPAGSTTIPPLGRIWMVIPSTNNGQSLNLNAAPLWVGRTVRFIFPTTPAALPSSNSNHGALGSVFPPPYSVLNPAHPQHQLLTGCHPPAASTTMLLPQPNHGTAATAATAYLDANMMTATLNTGHRFPTEMTTTGSVHGRGGNVLF